MQKTDKKGSVSRSYQNGSFKKPVALVYAQRLFRKMIQWRLEHKVDDILATYQPNPLLLDYASPMAFLKDTDHGGRPIYLERGGAMDAQGLLQRFSKEELYQHAIWLREVQSSSLWENDYKRRQGHPIKAITVVYDLQNLNYSHLSSKVLAYFQKINNMTEEYYRLWQAERVKSISLQQCKGWLVWGSGPVALSGCERVCVLFDGRAQGRILF